MQCIQKVPTNNRVPDQCQPPAIHVALEVDDEGCGMAAHRLLDLAAAPGQVSGTARRGPIESYQRMHGKLHWSAMLPTGTAGFGPEAIVGLCLFRWHPLQNLLHRIRRFSWSWSRSPTPSQQRLRFISTSNSLHSPTMRGIPTSEYPHILSFSPLERLCRFHLRCAFPAR